jgi:ABC-type transport system involved in cytochrome c biogenesis permease component
MNQDLREIVAVTLRMYLRNRMALAYSYVFPVMFLLAFVVLYKDEQPLLVQHMGELLTVTILGGACFGLPTSMVSERERGVWRRYRLSPVSPARVIVGTLIARYLMILVAGVLQVGACLIIGGFALEHPFQLWVAFSLVTFALLGLGLVIATMADTVPAVQALGQCIFLPMLILGGVAVKLSAFEDQPWVLHLSAFFPGRYAVEVMQQCAKGNGLVAAGFSAFAVIVTGLGAAVTGAKLFRWDAHQRFMASRKRAWLLAALGAWVLIGVGAEWRREIAPRSTKPSLRPRVVPGPIPEAPPATMTPSPAVNLPPAPEPSGSAPTAAVPKQEQAPATPPVASTPTPAAAEVKSDPLVTTPAPAPAATVVTTESPAQAPAVAAPAPAPAAPTPWRAYTNVDFARLPFLTVPPDNGNETPIAPADEAPDDNVQADLNAVANALKNWAPGKVADPVQRVRNLMYVASAVDQAKATMERHLPYVIMNQLRSQFEDRELTQILCWIANHPAEGEHSVLFRLDELGLLFNVNDWDVPEIRRRNEWYSIKFVWWLLGW